MIHFVNVTIQIINIILLCFFASCIILQFFKKISWLKLIYEDYQVLLLISWFGLFCTSMISWMTFEPPIDKCYGLTIGSIIFILNISWFVLAALFEMIIRWHKKLPNT